MRLAAALAAAALAPMTAGCVAAAALPFAAGAALAKRHDAIESRRQAAAPLGEAEPRGLGQALTAVPLSELPAPGRAPGTFSDPDIRSFASYALAQAAPPAPGRARTSAILPDANTLRITRTACGALPPAVMLDLDPGRGTFDPLAPGLPDRELPGVLAGLRAQGVAIFWLSRLGAGFEGATREALVASGLDPQGADTVLLLPDLAQRKQSLRDQVAKQYCPVAMLGDERADFDELFLYLRNPDAAFALDAMLGNGWFLASPFVTAQAGEPAGAGVGAGRAPDVSTLSAATGEAQGPNR